MLKLKKFFVGILKVNDEKSRIRIQDPDPDPVVRGMDLRIRIHSKMSWIRNTGYNSILQALFQSAQLLYEKREGSGPPSQIHTSN
jgi:hypothetical protein